MADRLQKQQEEMMDSSPDPMDMEVYLTKPRLKVVRPIIFCCLFFCTYLVTSQCSLSEVFIPPLSEYTCLVFVFQSRPYLSPTPCAALNNLIPPSPACPQLLSTFPKSAVCVA